MQYDSLHIHELQHAIATREDQQAYAELFARFAPQLIRFTKTIVQQQQVAEEIVSDVFIRIWEKRKSLDHVQHLKMYLYVSARNFAVNHLRSKNRQFSLQVDQLELDMAAISADPFEQTVGAEVKQELLQAIQELPDRCKIIFKLVKEDGLKQKEVAELLHLSPKTVENQLAIALKKLADAVQSAALFRSRK
ncbi:MAG: hypothetical protein RIR90_1310 [Bacteroidota bacterium]|jgi:RNA polymerase sigma-70 factor (ECF subfamily)